MKGFDQIYTTYYSALYGFLLRLTGSDPLLAEELTQETFYQAFISIHRYNGKCKFFTWLCQIAKNSYFKYLKKHKEVSVDFSRLGEELVYDRAANTEQLCEARLMKEELRSAVEGLKKQQKDVIILRIYFELSFKEISRTLGITEGSAKVTYHRGKAALQKN